MMMRKGLLLFFVLGSVFFLFLASSNVTAQPRSFELLCRGGGQLNFAFLFRPTGSELTMHFKRAAKQAQRLDDLAPGECGWPDRAVRSGEPDVVCQRIRDHIMVAWTADGRLGGRSSVEAPYITKLKSADNLMVLQVYNNQASVDPSMPKNCLVVTKIGPIPKSYRLPTQIKPVPVKSEPSILKFDKRF